MIEPLVDVTNSNHLIVRAIALVALPTVINVAGGYLIMRLSHAEEIREQLATPADQKGLGLRFLGYNSEQVASRWSKLDSRGLQSERLGLEIDLLFPFLYGATIAAALLCAWAALGRPFSLVWLIGPVAITMIADWTENCVQFSQLRQFDGTQNSLDSGMIQLASAATITKWIFLGVSSLLLIGSVCRMIGAAARRP